MFVNIFTKWFDLTLSGHYNYAGWIVPLEQVLETICFFYLEVIDRVKLVEQALGCLWITTICQIKHFQYEFAILKQLGETLWL